MRNSPSERKVHQKEILKNIVMSQSMWLIMAPWLLTINFNYLNLFLYLSGGNTLLGLLNRYNKQIKVKIFNCLIWSPSKLHILNLLKPLLCNSPWFSECVNIEKDKGPAERSIEWDKMTLILRVANKTVKISNGEKSLM